MKRRVLIEGYRPGGLDVFLSPARPDPFPAGRLTASGGAFDRPSEPMPKLPTGGSAIQLPRKN